MSDKTENPKQQIDQTASADPTIDSLIEDMLEIEKQAAAPPQWQTRTLKLRGEPLLTHLLKISRTMAEMRSVAPLLSYAIDEVMPLVGAERGYIVLIQPDGTFDYRVRRRVDGEEVSSKIDAISRSVLNEVVATQRSIVIRNATMDPRFGGSMSVMALQLRSVMCAPLITQNKLIGAIYVENRAKSGRFSDADLAPLEFFSNQAAVAIANANLNENLEQLVEDRTRELAAAKEAAEEANRKKTSFLSNMSHELRTPLNAIINFTGFVLDSYFGEVNSEQKEALEQVLGSGEHLLSLINDLLDLNKIEAGMIQVKIEPIDMLEVLHEVLLKTKGLLIGKPIELHIELPQTLSPVRFDRRHARQILLNLLSNSAKYTLKGAITVRAYETDSSIEISVEDTGIGISPEDATLIFESFQQGRNKLNNVASTGLGLPITQRLLDLHGGNIWFRSELDIGTTFFISIPKERASDLADK